MSQTLERIREKKQRLDGHKPLPKALLQNLSEWLRVELTYTSNAIEGNTLSRQETALVVEKGLTVTGKTLREHLEATNHAEAWQYIEHFRDQSRKRITEKTILEIHRIILDKIDSHNAGQYRDVAVRIAGSRVVLPNPQKVPTLMKAFDAWLQQRHSISTPTVAADAHLKLVSIHPFTDGNGRTARLLCNVILLKNGFPPAIIRPRDRKVYIASLETVQLGGNADNYYEIMYAAMARGLDLYLESLSSSEEIAVRDASDTLLKIGQLAKQCRESSSAIRYWVREGLIAPSGQTPGGYQLFSQDTLRKILQIRQWQREERLTITEIRNRLAH
jgi:Fic family protein